MTEGPAVLVAPAVDVKRHRERWNFWILAIPVQWIPLTAVFWLRFLPPFRPFEFHTPGPDPVVFALCFASSLIPCALPRSYFRPRGLERRAYERLGIRAFRYVAPDGDFVNARLRRLDPSYRAVATREALAAHVRGTYAAERAHLVMFLVGAWTTAFAAHAGLVWWAVVLGGLNIAFNAYPVMHQRYKRARARHAAHVYDRTSHTTGDRSLRVSDATRRGDR